MREWLFNVTAVTGQGLSQFGEWFVGNESSSYAILYSDLCHDLHAGGKVTIMTGSHIVQWCHKLGVLWTMLTTNGYHVHLLLAPTCNNYVMCICCTCTCNIHVSSTYMYVCFGLLHLCACTGSYNTWLVNAYTCTLTVHITCSLFSQCLWNTEGKSYTDKYTVNVYPSLYITGICIIVSHVWVWLIAVRGQATWHDRTSSSTFLWGLSSMLCEPLLSSSHPSRSRNDILATGHWINYTVTNLQRKSRR